VPFPSIFFALQFLELFVTCPRASTGDILGADRRLSIGGHDEARKPPRSLADLEFLSNHFEESVIARLGEREKLLWWW
jgi:hypothetical protein